MSRVLFPGHKQILFFWFPRSVLQVPFVEIEGTSVLPGLRTGTGSAQTTRAVFFFEEVNRFFVNRSHIHVAFVMWIHEGRQPIQGVVHDFGVSLHLLFGKGAVWVPIN